MLQCSIFALSLLPDDDKVKIFMLRLNSGQRFDTYHVGVDIEAVAKVLVEVLQFTCIGCVRDADNTFDRYLVPVDTPNNLI